jgi:hypothetical protein
MAAISATYKGTASILAPSLISRALQSISLGVGALYKKPQIRCRWTLHNPLAKSLRAGGSFAITLIIKQFLTMARKLLIHPFGGCRKFEGAW